ncbi:MAG: hypothetical protein N4A76_08365 [Firmicutes bacterium]|nr:hypothetical protein [Bacillota bacterium]
MKNYYTEFMKYVSNDISILIDKLISKSEEMNIKIYLTGGMVRDFFLNVETIDLDIVVDGDHLSFVEKIKNEILNNDFIKYSYNDKLMTAAFILEYCNLDVVQMRSEIYDKPGALPKVTPDSLFKDCHRRDFTINSLYFELSRYQFKLIDMDEYLIDLDKKILRVHHDNSFIDDPTRIFRAVKYLSRFNFKLDQDTLNLIKNALSNNCFTTISKERLIKEFTLILKEKTHKVNVITLCKLGIDKAILGVKINTNYDSYIDYNIDNEENNTLIHKFIELIYINRKIISYDNLLKYTNNKRVIEFINLVYTMDQINTEIADLDNYELFSFISKLTKEEVRFLKVRGDSIINEKLCNWEKIRDYKVIYKGDYVKNMGISDGKAIGRVLRSYKNKVFEIILEGDTTVDEKLIIDEIIKQEKRNGI